MATAVASRKRSLDDHRTEQTEWSALIRHGDGCPGLDEEGKATADSRVERFTAQRPRNVQFPLGGTVEVFRCNDCGRDFHRDLKESV